MKPISKLASVLFMLTTSVGLVGTASADPTGVPEFAPMPADSKPRADGPDGYQIQKVGKSAYVVIVGFVQATFVVTSKGVVVIDAPPAMIDKLQAAIKKTTKLPVTHVILTHSHFDHIGGATKFKDAKLVAHELTAKVLAVYPDPDRPAPAISFPGDKYTLTVGDEKFELIYPGPNHETGNIIVYVPSDKLAIMTDLVMPGWAPYRGWGNADYIPGILKSHDVLLTLDFDTYVGGHVYRTGTKKDVQESRDFLVDLFTETRKAMGEVPFAAKVEVGNAWAAQTVWFDQVATRVTSTLVAKWKMRLAGVDTFTHDTVIAAIVSLSTDAPKIPGLK